MRLLLAFTFLLCSFWSSAQVVQQWKKDYDNWNGRDMVHAMVLDSARNVYVTGPSWDASIDEEDYVTIKYAPDGTQLWLKEYDNFSGPDISNDIVLDAAGNVYITGSSWDGSVSEEDIVTIKYDNNGVQQWVADYDASFGKDVGHALQVDAAGNVYVVGEAYTSSISEEDLIILKYSPDGALLWDTTIDHSFGRDVIVDLVLDSAANLYMAGTVYQNSVTEADFLTMKFDSAGNQLWFHDFDLSFGDDYATELILDKQGNVVVTGTGDDGLVTEEQFLTFKYDSDGNELWHRTHDLSFGPDIANAVAIDQLNNVIVAGGGWDGIISEENYMIIKYSATGDTIWEVDYDHSFGPDVITDMVLDSADNIFVTGSAWDGSISEKDYLTMKFDANGVEQWQADNDEWNGLDSATAIAVDVNGSVYISGGGWDGNSSEEDFITIKYCDVSGMSVGSSASICPTDSTSLLASGGDTYLWSPASSLDDATLANPTASPNATTTYTVVISSADGCSRSMQQTVTVLAPAGMVSGGTAICEGDSAVLTGSGAATYSWSPSPSLSNLNQAQTTATPLTTETYQVDMVDSLGCASTHTVTVTVNPIPVGSILNDTTVCAGACLNLPVSGGSSYAWFASANLSSQTSSNPQTCATGSELYTCVVSDQGCSDTVSVQVNRSALPVLSISNDTLICPGDSASLWAGGADSYTWSPSNSLNDPNTANPFAFPTQTTTYQVSGADSLGCSGSESVVVSVYSLPQIWSSATDNICIGDSVLLDAGNYQSFQWSTGDTTQSIYAPSAGAYTVTVTNQNGCEITDNLTLVQRALPNVNLGPDTMVCLNHNFQLNAGFGQSAYLWNTSATSQSITVTSSGTYSVLVTSSHGCQNSDTVEVTVSPCTGLAEQGTELVIQIFPNPARTQLTVAAPSSEALDQIELLDALGRVVYQHTNPSSVHRISVAHLAPGLYTVRCLSGSSYSAQPIVIAR